jgi:regulator of replication initiation timing
VTNVSNIHSLVLHVEQLIKQNQLLQQENQTLRNQTAEQEETLATLTEQNQDQAGFSAEDEATMTQLLSLLDAGLGGSNKEQSHD